METFAFLSWTFCCVPAVFMLPSTHAVSRRFYHRFIIHNFSGLTSDIFLGATEDLPSL